MEGDPTHPANHGRLCSKGTALGDTIDLEGRLLTPRIGGREASWEAAVGLVAKRFSQAIAAHGPDSVAFYVSGQLLSEDYYVANKLMKGFIGSANIDSNSRLCMASSVAGHIRAFGADTVPGTYEDFEEADLVVLVGSNLAWCHPVLFQRLSAAKEVRPEMRVVNIDPRRTATSAIADMELRLAADSDVALFNGLLRAIEDKDAVDASYADAHVSGMAEALECAREASPATVAEATGLSEATLESFYALWVGNPKVVTLYSQGVNQSTCGTDKVNAIINCHLASGRIGRPGMGPFSITGQPNAMGGREVGGLSTTLACHLQIHNEEHRRALEAFWMAPRIAKRAGLKAVDMVRACADGRIKALWIMCTNPVVSQPDADFARRAIAACPFVVVSDVTAETETARLADVLLPAAAWGEKSGTVTNSDRHISRQRAFLPIPGEARADWRIICDVARAMGWREAFDYKVPSAIFREFARLSGLSGRLGRDFDMSALAGLDDEAYEALAPLQWPVTEARQGGRLFADGGYFTPDRRARMVAVRQAPVDDRRCDDYPLRLNSGRVRDQWHTMTRTAKSARLSRHLAEPFVEIHPADAERHAIAAADLVQVESRRGAVVMRAIVSDGTQEGSVFLPMHWSCEWASQARIGALIRADTDPHSGQPALKSTAVGIRRFAAAWHGFALSRQELRPSSSYWARCRIPGGWQSELADLREPSDWADYLRDLVGEGCYQVVSLLDPARGSARIALCDEGGPSAVLFVAPAPLAIARGYVIDAFAKGAPAAEILAGRPKSAHHDPGPLVCACLEVGANTIRSAIAKEGLESFEAVVRCTGAGSSCGSCRSEIGHLLSAS